MSAPKLKLVLLGDLASDDETPLGELRLAGDWTSWGVDRETFEQVAELLGVEHVVEHDCDQREHPDGDLRFVAHYGAPGVGQAWACVVCEREFARVGGTFYDPRLLVHELSPEDVR